MPQSGNIPAYISHYMSLCVSLEIQSGPILSFEKCKSLIHTVRHHMIAI